MPPIRCSINLGWQRNGPTHTVCCTWGARARGQCVSTSTHSHAPNTNTHSWGSFRRGSKIVIPSYPALLLAKLPPRCTQLVDRTQIQIALLSPTCTQHTHTHSRGHGRGRVAESALVLARYVRTVERVVVPCVLLVRRLRKIGRAHV